MTTYFTSDTHYFHRNIIDYCDRPFADVEEMNEALIENWNSVVQETDTVYHLGDFAMGKGTTAESVREILRRLRGRKIFVLGNHDEKTLARWTNNDEFLDGTNLLTIPLDSVLRFGKYDVLLSHYPYKDVSRHNGRYEAVMPKDTGLWLFHGHTHQKDVFTEGVERQLHVGVDSWEYTPVAVDTLLQLMG